MKKTQTKFFRYSVAILSMVILVFIFISYSISFSIHSYLLKFAFWLILSVLLSFIITYGYTLTSSSISDAMATLRRMIRAENLSNPLLMRLSSEAPGTYHHSLNVSNLAQRAAKSIGADSLLVRVAAYYHDLGKLNEPKVFVENQSEKELLQEENSATWIRSNAKKIISHVEQGVKLAKEAKLPEEIIDIIAEHHGNSKVLYFYTKAKEKGLKIRKSDFAYPGPKPQSPESAIIMLADCVEAWARTIHPINKDNISEIVSSTIEEKLKENQLSRSGLSEIELSKIKSSLIDTLLIIYHQRISYDHKNEN